MRRGLIIALWTLATFAASLLAASVLYVTFLFAMTIVAPLLHLFLGWSIDLRLLGSDAVAYIFVPFIAAMLAAGALVLGVKGRLPGTRSDAVERSARP